MNYPKVSVLTTVFNRSKYLAACIESVLNSSEKDWEMIIVDDGSTDNSVQIAREYEKRDARIKVHANEKNLGDYPNRNKAATYATGKYLKYLDADDIIYPHGLQVMIEAMEKFPEAALGTQYNVREYKKPYPFLINSREAFYKHYFGNSFFQSGPTGTIIKREDFEQVGGFSGKRHIGDTELWMKLSLNKPVVVFQPSLIWWRQHEEQEIVKENANPVIRFERLLFDLEFLKKHDNILEPNEFKKALLLKKQHLARYILSVLIKKKNIHLFRSFLKKSGLTNRELLSGINTYR